MLFLCIRTVCLCNRNLEEIDGVTVTTRAQVLPCSVGQKYGNTRGVRLCTNNSKEDKATGWTKIKLGFGQDVCRKRK